MHGMVANQLFGRAPLWAKERGADLRHLLGYEDPLRRRFKPPRYRIGKGRSGEGIFDASGIHAAGAFGGGAFV